MNRITQFVYHFNPLQKRYQKAHQALHVVAQARQEDGKVLRRFFKNEQDVLTWYKKLEEEGRLLVH